MTLELFAMYCVGLVLGTFCGFVFGHRAGARWQRRVEIRGVFFPPGSSIRVDDKRRN